ncbi:MAG: SRPBCC domain-containing protein, partial [Bacteroidota bacterium]
MKQEKITITATIAADKQKVWNYYTQPEHITQWNFADPSWHCPAASNDLQPGGQYFARMEAKDGSFGFDFIAIYTEIQLIETFTYQFGDRTATANFSENNGSTAITISFDPETENPIELQRNGWQAILHNFKNYAENN